MVHTLRRQVFGQHLKLKQVRCVITMNAPQVCCSMGGCEQRTLRADFRVVGEKTKGLKGSLFNHSARCRLCPCLCDSRPHGDFGGFELVPWDDRLVAG